MKLNGWQRLWIVTSVIYILPVFFFAYITFPESNAHQFFGRFAKLDAKEDWDIELKREFIIDTAKSRIRLKGNGHQSDKRNDDEYHKYLIDRWGKLIDLDFSRVNYSRLHHILIAFSLWLLPLVIIYIFGYAVSWVRHGFKNET